MKEIQEEKVSDKYTTDGLIGCLEAYRTFQRDMFTKEEIDAIIARLRAADALCAAAKEVLSDSGPLEDEGWPDQHQRDLWKAIADYEPIPAS
jgi:hypothetical protein